MRIYREALESKAVWILVIEDDARSVGNGFLSGKADEILAKDQIEEIRFVNLSESITPEELGVAGILQTSIDEKGDHDHSLATCSRPITNTVCANVFSRGFVNALVTNIESHGLSPVIPIDWRLNRMIMDEWSTGKLDSTSCSWVVPGIFLQGSMHSLKDA
jgi:hypothetical protein